MLHRPVAQNLYYFCDNPPSFNTTQHAHFGSSHTMKYKNLRDFIGLLKEKEQLACINESVSPHLEMPHLCDRVLQQQGPRPAF
ncbi:MAG: hypothetical protein HC848_05040 [Limnobacter sp.]|nr:hypothetical protein [Limnobacter sp.]